MHLGRAPLRISLGGGGTDLEEYHSRYGGCVLSSTISLYTYVMARVRLDCNFQGFTPDFAAHIAPNKIGRISPRRGHEIVLACLKALKFSDGADVFFCSDVAPKSGLGASSSLTANMVNLLTRMQGKTWSKIRIATTAYTIGHDCLRWSIGKQDELASMFGGFNLFTFHKRTVTVDPVKMSKSSRQEMGQKSMLFNLGHRKDSYEILSAQIARIKKSHPPTLDALHNTKRLALEMHGALKGNDLTKFSLLLNEAWEFKKRHASAVTNQRVEGAIRLAAGAGADSWKVTGAGGGGHLFVMAPGSRQPAIEKKLKGAGIRRIDFNYTRTGATVMDLGRQ